MQGFETGVSHLNATVRDVAAGCVEAVTVCIMTEEITRGRRTMTEIMLLMKKKQVKFTMSETCHPLCISEKSVESVCLLQIDSTVFLCKNNLSLNVSHLTTCYFVYLRHGYIWHCVP